MSATTFAALIKEAIANMPDTLNSKKEIDEYYKKAIKDVKEKVNEENKGGKAPRKALGVKPAKAAKAAPKKRPKKVDVDADGNEIEKVKKPPNAYQQFIKDNRTKVKEENPGLNNEEYFTLLASKWNKHKEDMKNKDKKEEDKEEDKEEEKKADTVDTEITVDAEDKKKKDKEKKKDKKENK